MREGVCDFLFGIAESGVFRTEKFEFDASMKVVESVLWR